MAWEVRQWRESRSREPQEPKRMMLVRTEAGYLPAPVDQDDGLAPAQKLPTERETPPNGRVDVAVDATRTIAARPEPTADPASAVPLSKKAVAVGIALAVGLPFGSQVLKLSDGTPDAARQPAAAPARVAPARPVPPVARRSGFMQLSSDAVRYAVVFRNPNRSHAVRDIVVSVSFHDGAGRLVGTDIERMGAIPAGASVAIAGTTEVAGRVADLRARISVGVYEAASSARPFVVRSVRLSRSGRDLIVRASVSGARATAGARAIAVHFDAKGAIIGGDFAYVDVPRGPRSTIALISTSGLASRVRRVEIYVVAAR